MASHGEIDWDQVHLSNYESRAFWHIHWMYIAKDLIESAKLLEPRIEEVWENLHAHSQNQSVALIPDHYTGPYFMLMGFAIENILKAGIVFRDSTELKLNFGATRKFPGILKDHDLPKLAKKAGIRLGTDEEDLLRRLTRHSVWAGRYPIPIEYRDIKSTEVFSDGEERLITWRSKQDAFRIEDLVKRLSIELGLESES